MMTFRSDAYLLGFEEDEIVAFLAGHGIEIGVGSASVGAVFKRRFPDWLRLMSRLPTLSETEVASALSGIELDSSDGLSDDERLELSRYLDLVRRSIAAGELPAKSVEHVSGDKGEHWEIAPRDLASWCNSKGLEYPFGDVTPIPQTDSALRETLVKKTQELSDANVRLRELEGEREHRSKLAAEVGSYKRAAAAASKEASDLRDKLKEVQQDLLVGKERNTALKLIGGLLKAAYGSNALADRLQISQILDDLETGGAKVSERTLRHWINDARALIENHPNVP